MLQPAKVMKAKDEKAKETGFTYEFDEQTGILFKNYFGPVNLKTLISSWDDAIAKQIIPANTKGFILDYRKATLKVGLHEFTGIPDYYKSHPEIFENKKIAILVDNPRDTVVPILVREKDSGYESKPFSTLEAAIQWILENW